MRGGMAASQALRLDGRRLRLGQGLLLGSDSNPSGGKVVTYAGWPLYTYVADTGPGTASGQAKNLNGGLWYVISPAGTVIKKQSKSSSTY